MPPKKPTQPKNVETFTYEDASRKNIPTAEFQSVKQNRASTVVASPQGGNKQGDEQVGEVA